MKLSRVLAAAATAVLAAGVTLLSPAAATAHRSRDPWTWPRPKTRSGSWIGPAPGRDAAAATLRPPARPALPPIGPSQWRGGHAMIMPGEGTGRTARGRLSASINCAWGPTPHAKSGPPARLLLNTTSNSV